MADERDAEQPFFMYNDDRKPVGLLRVFLYCFFSLIHDKVPVCCAMDKRRGRSTNMTALLFSVASFKIFATLCPVVMYLDHIL